MRLDGVWSRAALLALAGLVVFSCSSSEDNNGAGGAPATAGSAGTVGGSAGTSGSGGTAGSAGSSSGASGSSGTGGSSSGASGTSGTGGGASGVGGSSGTAGSGGDPAACDNCVKDSGIDAQGCAMVDLGDASAGADTDRALCEQILSCTRQTQCVAQEPVMSDPNYQPGTYCFCGTLTPDACFGGVVGGPNYKPDGPCSALILQAYPAGSPPVAYGSAYFDTATPIGAAIQRALGEASFCANQCGLTGAAGAGP